MTDLLFRASLPVPPSVNALYKRTLNRKGRRPRTEAYEQWIAEAGWLVRVSPWLNAVKEPIPIKHCRIEMTMPIDYRSDVSNRVKAVEDLLVSHGVLVDDRWVDELVVRRVPVTEPLTVSVWQAGAV